MKKTISILLTLMMVLSIVVLAQSPPVPKPIRGYFTINGQGTAGYIVEATNTYTGETISGDTINSLITELNGFFFDLSYFSQGVEGPSRNYAGDVIEVQIRGFGDEGKVSFNVPSSTPYEISINIETTSPPPPQQILCPDGSLVLNADDCPEVVEPEPEPEVETKVSSNEDKDVASVEADYGQDIKIELAHNKLNSLIDTKIDFYNEDYDVREKVYLTARVLTSIDYEDYGLDPYLVLEEGAIEYRYIFDDVIDIDDIHLEEPLEITFLGKEINIIEASNSEVVIRSGREEFLSEEESILVSGKVVEVVNIGEDSILIDVDGTKEIIADGNDKEINGIHVLVDNILFNDEKRYVELIVGTEGDKTVKDGDDFELFIEDDETYKWSINLPDYIGIVSQEEYKSVDEDEEFVPLTVGDSLSLPNNYVDIKFNSVSSSDLVELTFRVKDDQLLIKGSDDAFVSGTDEYDKIYIDSTGIYDDDDVLISTDKVRLGDSDTYLELGSVKIGLLTIKLDMSDILYDGISYLAEEGNFLDYLGIIFKDPENAVDDQSGFKVSIPEERPEATITFSAGTEVEDEDVIVVVDDEEEEEEDDVVVIPPDDDVVVTPSDAVILPPVVKIVCEDGTEVDKAADCIKVIPPVDDEKWGDTLFEQLLNLVAVVLGALGVQWKRGILGIVRYHWKAGRKAQAMKTLFTLAKRAKEDYYKKKG